MTDVTSVMKTNPPPSLDDQIEALVKRIQSLDQPENAAELAAIRRENPAYDAPHDAEDEANWASNTDDNIQRARQDKITVDDVFDPCHLRDDLRKWLADWYEKRPYNSPDDAVTALLPVAIELYGEKRKNGDYGEDYKNRPAVAAGLEMLMRKSIALNIYFWVGDPCLANMAL